jgi:rRNA maturation endonuclease Nob1
MWGKVRSWTFECLDCEWRKTTPPTGDALLQGLTHFEVCPACGSESLVRRESTEVERLVESLMPRRRAAR